MDRRREKGAEEIDELDMGSLTRLIPGCALGWRVGLRTTSSALLRHILLFGV